MDEETGKRVVAYMQALESAGFVWERSPPTGNVRIACRECGLTWNAGPTVTGPIVERCLEHAGRHRDWARRDLEPTFDVHLEFLGARVDATVVDDGSPESPLVFFALGPERNHISPWVRGHILSPPRGVPPALIELLRDEIERRLGQRQMERASWR